MIVNADDMISNSLCKIKVCSALMFSQASGSSSNVHSRYYVKLSSGYDASFSPLHHIGRAYCPHCGLEAPEPDVTISHFDWAEDTVRFAPDRRRFFFPVLLKNC